MFFFLSIHEYRNETFKIKSQFFSLHTLNIGSAVKKIPIFFFTHSKYRIIFNEWKTTASLFSPAFLFLPMFKAKYSKYSFYIQISSLKQRARLLIPLHTRRARRLRAENLGHWNMETIRSNGCATDAIIEKKKEKKICKGFE